MPEIMFISALISWHVKRGNRSHFRLALLYLFSDASQESRLSIFGIKINPPTIRETIAAINTAPAE